jgi:hypothetical protein
MLRLPEPPLLGVLWFLLLAVLYPSALPSSYCRTKKFPRYQAQYCHYYCVLCPVFTWNFFMWRPDTFLSWLNIITRTSYAQKNPTTTAGSLGKGLVVNTFYTVPVAYKSGYQHNNRRKDSVWLKSQTIAKPRPKDSETFPAELPLLKVVWKTLQSVEGVGRRLGMQTSTVSGTYCMATPAAYSQINDTMHDTIKK